MNRTQWALMDAVRRMAVLEMYATNRFGFARASSPRQFAAVIERSMRPPERVKFISTIDRMT